MDTIFYCPDIQHSVEMPESESQHCARVLRMKEGDKLLITDGKGYFYRAQLLQSHPKRCIIEIETKIAQPKEWTYDLEIAFAPTKNIDRTEWFVEKATEIGIDILSPINCRYSERKNINNKRIEKKMIAAMKQSLKSRLPQNNAIIDFEKLIKRPFEGQKFIAHCFNTDKASLATICKPNCNTLILIGPEGDFSEEEVTRSIEEGFVPVSLGESRLRSETAALVACHTVHLINELR